MCICAQLEAVFARSVGKVRQARQESFLTRYGYDLELGAPCWLNSMHAPAGGKSRKIGI